MGLCASPGRKHIPLLHPPPHCSLAAVHYSKHKLPPPPPNTALSCPESEGTTCRSTCPESEGLHWVSMGIRNLKVTNQIAQNSV